MWDDAETDQGWEEIPDALAASVATSVGFLIKESEHHVLIASSYDSKHTNGRLQIPRGMIKEITILIPKGTKD